MAASLASRFATATRCLESGASSSVSSATDGTVMAVGDNSYGECDVSGWSGIQQVSAGYCVLPPIIVPLLKLELLACRTAV